MYKEYEILKYEVDTRYTSSHHWNTPDSDWNTHTSVAGVGHLHEVPTNINFVIYCGALFFSIT